MLTSSPAIKIKFSGSNMFTCTYLNFKSKYTTPKYPVTQSNITEIIEQVTQYFITEHKLFCHCQHEISTYCELKELTEYLIIIKLND